MIFNAWFYVYLFGKFNYNLFNFVITINRFTNPFKKVYWVCDRLKMLFYGFLGQIYYFQLMQFGATMSMFVREPWFESPPKWFNCCVNI